jgi:putative membrane protein
MILRRALEEPFRRHSLMALIAAFAAMLCIFFVKPDDTAVALIRQPSVSEAFQLVLYSAFSAAAMVIPGVSGSFFMMLFGVYHSVLTAVSEINLSVLLPVGVGMAAGVLFCAKLIDLCMQHAKQAMYFGILGCVLGSIPNIWPQGFSVGEHLGIAILFFALGMAVSLFCTSQLLHRLIRRLSSGSSTTEDPPGQKIP